MLSFQKLLLLLTLIIATWYGFKRWGKSNRVQGGGQAGRTEDRSAARAPKLGVEPLTRCPVCGVYVGARTARPCGRTDCPIDGAEARRAAAGAQGS